MNNKPWLKFYEPHVPEHIDYPDIVLTEALQQTAQNYPRRSAIIFKGASISYEEFNRLVNRFAAGLQSLGVKKGDRIALLLPNCPQYPIAFYAVLRIGGILAPCNPLYQAPELKRQVADSGAEVMVTLSSLYPLVKTVRNQTALKHVIVAQIKTYFPPHLRVLFSLLREKKMGHHADISSDANTYWFTDLLKKGEQAPKPVAVSGDDVAVLMYTGGTTGISKGAMLTHRNILVNAYQCKVWLNARDAEHTTMVQMPLFHCYGMTTGMNFSVLSAGTMVLVPDPRDVDDIVKTLTHSKPTLYPGVPAIYNAINNYPKIQTHNLKSIRLCISGASGLPVQVQKRFQDLTGARLVEGYGLSEASPVTHANPLFGENRIGTIGLPWPDTNVKIVDVDSGTRVLGVGETGELCIQGPQVMKGYWNMRHETENVLKPDPSGLPWLYTGDIAMMDQDGYFRIEDRKKDMILGMGGFNIYPREIEEVLYMHPKVLEAAAVGIPVEDRGERVKVFIALKPGEKATAEEIIAFCREQLAPFKVPKFVEFRDSLPKTIMGKPLRRELRDQELEKLPAKPRERTPA